VLCVSTQYPFYPGTGAAREIGAGAGRGYNINIPMPHGCGDDAYRRAFEEVVLPALRRYRPELILVSAGYDAHFADEIAGEQLSVDGYGALTSMLKQAAGELCGGRLLFALEGGYHLVALPWSIRRTIEVLRGDAPTPDPIGTPVTDTPHAFDAMLAEVTALHGCRGDSPHAELGTRRAPYSSVGFADARRGMHASRLFHRGLCTDNN
jgi:acetoin utilization deacetylase AcuC-like enzyme